MNNIIIIIIDSLILSGGCVPLASLPFVWAGSRSRYDCAEATKLRLAILGP